MPWLHSSTKYICILLLIFAIYRQRQLPAIGAGAPANDRGSISKPGP
jgi:hypothetical protein